MRVLLVSDFYPPAAGGVERHVQDLAEGLQERGHVVRVATVGTRAQAPVRVDAVGGLLEAAAGLYAQPERRFALPVPDPVAAIRLARLVRSFRPDVMHAHSWLGRSLQPIRAATRRPLVVTLHDYGLACPKKNLLFYGADPCSGPGLTKCPGCASAHYGPLRGLPIAAGTWLGAAGERALADRLIVVSEAVAEGNGLRARGIEHELIPDFLPPGEPAPADLDRYLEQLPREPFLLFVGALGRHKGIEVLFEAVRRLHARAIGRIPPMPIPPLVVIGHRWDEMRLEPPPGTLLLGEWPHAAVVAAWSRALAGIVPSIWPEPFGIVALEAMAAGRPVIASRIGGLPEVVRDGETGLLVTPGDPEDLADALGRIVRDRMLTARLGAAAAAHAQLFARDLLLPRIERIYEEAAAAAEPARRAAHA